jgi:5,5'-dehydrodivanillate O-demethylase
VSVSIRQAPAAKHVRVDFASSGPGTPGGKLLRAFWQPVFLSADLAPESMFPIHVMGERFTLYRGASGTAHVVGFRCPHRNTQLSPGWVRGDAVQCLYHGWTFNGAGNCIERPGEQPPGPCAHVSIPAYATHEHRGIIYAYFGPGDPPPFPASPGFPAGGLVENLRIEYPCNWFQTYENQVDEVHAAFVHSQSRSHVALGREQNLPETLVTETDYGFDRITWSTDSPKRLCVYPFPNHMRMIMGMMAIGLPRPIDGFLTLVPTDDENHLLYMSFHVPISDPDAVAAHHEKQRSMRARFAEFPSIGQVARAILAGKATLRDAMDHPFKTAIEDAVTQLGQGAIHDRTKEVLGRTDVGVAAIRKVFERELRAVADDRAGKHWSFGGMPAPTKGF